MMTLLGSLLGFLGAFAPELLKILRDAADKKHEITILTLQMEQAKQGHVQRLEEINGAADIAEALAIRRPLDKVGVAWVDAYVSSVRPTLTYAFFILYAVIKIVMLEQLGVDAIIETPWLVWTLEDQAIFAAIISFWFGQRAMHKVRGK